MPPLIALPQYYYNKELQMNKELYKLYLVNEVDNADIIQEFNLKNLITKYILIVQLSPTAFILHI